MNAVYQFDAPRRNGIAAEARLDNRAELLRALALPAAASDAALLWAAYERWGEDCPRLLLGDFAFAIHDAAAGRLFCARDHLGIKPLCYHAGPRACVCASSPEAVLAHAGLEPQPDDRALARALLDLPPEPAATPYRGVQRLPAAHALSVSPAGLRLWRYWDPANTPVAHYASEADAVARFAGVFTEAVYCRLPAAATLSGGLDSSAIACVARPRAYSVRFESLPCDEGPCIDACGLDVDNWIADGPEAWPDYEKQIEGVPFDPTFAMNCGLLRRARARGERALLWGCGGDELLTAGSAYITDLLAQRRYREALGTVRERARYYGTGAPRMAAGAWLLPYRRPRPVPPRWLRREFLRRTGALAPAPRLERRLPTVTQDRICAELEHGRGPNLSLPALDALARAFGLEFRYPFYDRRLVEYVLGLPARHVELLDGKLVLREALRGVLPELVRTRLDKTGFDALIDREFAVRQVDTIGDLVRGSALAQAGMVDAEALEDRFEQYRRDPRFGRNEMLAFVRAEAWLRGLHTTERTHHDPIRTSREQAGGPEALCCAAVDCLR